MKLIYYDKNKKRIRQGDILDFDFGNSKNVMPVSKQNGELGIQSGNEFVPLSETKLEYANLKRPKKKSENEVKAESGDFIFR